VRDIPDAQQPIVLGRLPREAIAGPQGTRFERAGERESGHAPEPAAFRDEKRANLSVQILAQVPQDIVAQAIERQIALHQPAQSQLAGADPRLALACAEIPRGDRGRAGDQEKQHRGAARGDREGEGGGLTPLLRPLRDQLALLILHLIDHQTNPVHRALAAVGEHERQRGIRLAGALEVDGFGQLLHLV
jgi:hypothetical protein